VSKNTGTIIGIHGKQSGHNIRNVIPTISSPIYHLYNVLASIPRLRAAAKGVKFDIVLQKPEKMDLERIGRCVEEGKIRAVVGEVVKLGDLAHLRSECERIDSGKGGRAGRVVVEIV
jgi:hypothetical protein